MYKLIQFTRSRDRPDRLASYAVGHFIALCGMLLKYYEYWYWTKNYYFFRYTLKMLLTLEIIHYLTIFPATTSSTHWKGGFSLNFFSGTCSTTEQRMSTCRSHPTWYKENSQHRRARFWFFTFYKKWGTKGKPFWWYKECNVSTCVPSYFYFSLALLIMTTLLYTVKNGLEN